MSDSQVWYKVSFTKTEIIANAEIRFANELGRVTLDPSMPIGAVIFNGHPGEGSVYLIPPDAFPTCRETVIRFSGEPCNKPQREGLGLFQFRGKPEDAWGRYFAENDTE